jgi:aminopeptidase
MYEGYARGDTVLIVTDTDTDLSIAQVLYDRANSLGCDAVLMTMEPRNHHGQEPPAVVAEAMKAADVVLAPTSRSISDIL